MTRSQRQSLLNRRFAEIARAFAQEKGLVYAGTLRQLPPPVFPGCAAEATRYYVNALFPEERITRMVELDAPRKAAMAAAELWVEDGEGLAPWDAQGKTGATPAAGG